MSVSGMGVDLDHPIAQELLGMSYADTLKLAQIMLSHIPDERLDELVGLQEKAMTETMKVLDAECKTNAEMGYEMIMCSHAFALSFIGLTHQVALAKEIDDIENGQGED